MSQALARLQERTFAASRTATADSYPAERRLSGEQLATYLDRRNFAVVCSTRPGGRAHAALSGFVRREDVFWLPTVAESVRERNIRSHPWMSMVVTEGDHEGHIAVLLEGTAQVVSPADAPEVASTITGSWVSCWIALRAQHLLSYGDEATIGSPRFPPQGPTQTDKSGPNADTREERLRRLPAGASKRRKFRSIGAVDSLYQPRRRAGWRACQYGARGQFGRSCATVLPSDRGPGLRRG